MKGVHIFLADGFEDIEALATCDVLRRGGVKVNLIGISDEPFVVSSHGLTVGIEESISDLDMDDHHGTDRRDVMIFPGGMPGSKHLAGCKPLIKAMKAWGNKYPKAGYGGRFRQWLFTDRTKPYNSYGNGSGMRVSPVGWLYDTILRTREVARWTAEVTHNHPEGVKGAESTAAAIFLARNGASKEDIRDYIEKEFGYDLSRTLDEIRPTYEHVEDCMRTMPEAFECFLEAESYEDCVRNVMYIGGDTDTLAAIAGAVAEAFWGIPVSLVIKGKEYLTADIEGILDRFNDIVHFS